MIAFAVIAVAAGLIPEQRALAFEAGPAQVAAGDGYADLIRRAGFRDAAVRDISGAYGVTAAAWIREWDAQRAELEQLVGADEFAGRQSRRRRALRVIEAGLLKRYLFMATRP